MTRAAGATLLVVLAAACSTPGGESGRRGPAEGAAGERAPDPGPAPAESLEPPSADEPDTLLRYGYANAVKVLRKGLESPDPETRRKAAQAIGEVFWAPPGLVERLYGLLDDPNFEVRREAAFVLSGKAGKTADWDRIVPALVEAIEFLPPKHGPDRHPGKTGEAAAAVGNAGPAAAPAIPGLLLLLRAQYGESWYEASQSLSALCPTAIPPLLDLLNDPETPPSLARWILDVFGEARSRALSALPAILALLEDPETDRERRHAARVAIGDSGGCFIAAAPSLAGAKEHAGEPDSVLHWTLEVVLEDAARIERPLDDGPFAERDMAELKAALKWYAEEAPPRIRELAREGLAMAGVSPDALPPALR